MQTWAHLFFVRKSTVFWWLTFGTNAKVGEVTNQWHRQQYNGKRKGVSPSVRAMQPAYCCYSNTVHASRPQKGNLARPRAKLLMPIQGKNQILVESWKTTFHQRSLENQFSLGVFERCLLWDNLDLLSLSSSFDLFSWTTKLFEATER